MTTTEHQSGKRVLWQLTDLAAAMGLGLTKLRELVRTGELESVRVGDRVLVPDEAVTAYVERLHKDARKQRAS